MERKEINGIKVIHEFKMFHHEWECDGYGWVAADGKIWLTNHGHLCEGDVLEIIDNIDELAAAISDMNKAIRLSIDKSPKPSAPQS